MARLPTEPLMISLLATISTVFGCGVMPAGQVNTRSFIVSGFSLPVAMVHTGDSAVSARFPGIATSKNAAKAFVQRLIMQTIFDVLESQGRSALLPDAVILSILSQLSVTTNYAPMECQKAFNPSDMINAIESGCIIVGNMVTGICTGVANGRGGMCNMAVAQMVEIMPISANHASISGTLSTRNIIMANWSKAMWESVVNRAIRMLASRPFEPHFFSASASISGN